MEFIELKDMFGGEINTAAYYKSNGNGGKWIDTGKKYWILEDYKYSLRFSYCHPNHGIDKKLFAFDSAIKGFSGAIANPTIDIIKTTINELRWENEKYDLIFKRLKQNSLIQWFHPGESYVHIGSDASEI